MCTKQSVRLRVSVCARARASERACVRLRAREEGRCVAGMATACSLQLSFRVSSNRDVYAPNLQRGRVQGRCDRVSQL